jgi:uncharacterized protein YjbI with pentapeptide repeats
MRTGVFAGDFDGMPASVGDLLKASNDQSAQARTTWFTFLLLGVYLAVAVASTTHKQLLLEAPIALPLLGVTLPMVAFFELAPWLFVLAHFFMLVQVYLLSRTLNTFNNAGPDASLRAQLDSFPITQLIAGERGNWLAYQFVRLSCWITLLLAPLALLLEFQLQFLAYHDVATTYVHRAAIVADLLIIWLLWPAITDARGRFGSEAIRLAASLVFRLAADLPRGLNSLRASRVVDRRNNAADGVAVPKPRSAARERRRLTLSLGRSVFIGLSALAGCFVIVCFSFFVATIPEERLEKWVASWFPDVHASEIRKACGLRPTEPKRVQNLRTLRCLLSPRVWTGVRSASNDANLGMNGRAEEWRVWWPTVVLFEGAVDYVNERPSSWFARNLVLLEANLVGADSERLAKLDRTATLRLRDLRFANFYDANLQKADLNKADLTGADFRQANLQYADMTDAVAKNARFDDAHMTGAKLERTLLDGASMRFADLQGANLAKATLNGSDLTQINALGANLGEAVLRASTLVWASLEGADLTAADVSGSDMGNVVLDGAELDCVDLSGTGLSNASLVATDGDPGTCDHAQQMMQFADLSGAVVKKRLDAATRSRITNWLAEAAKSNDLVESRQRLTVMLSSPAMKDRYPRAVFWKSYIDHMRTNDDIQNLAIFLARLGCDNGAYVATGVVRRILNAKNLNQDHDQSVDMLVSRVSALMLKEECKGASQMSEANRNRLHQLAKANNTAP